MAKKRRTEVPHFAPAAGGGKRAAAAAVKPDGTRPPARQAMKPQATSAKSGRRGQ
jgi:hypothetical protein